MSKVLIDEVELRKLQAIANLARHLDVVITEFGPDPAYVAEAAQALHDKLNGGSGYLQLCNVCYGIPVPGTGRCTDHTPTLAEHMAEENEALEDRARG